MGFEVFEKKLVLGIGDDAPSSRITIRQGYVNTIVLNISFLLNKQAFVLPVGTTARFRMSKHDKKPIDDTTHTTVVGNSVLVSIDEEMQSSAGDGQCEIILTNGVDSIPSAMFVLTVLPSVIGDGVIESSPEFTTLSEALVVVGAIESLEVNYAPRLNIVEAELADKATSVELTESLSEISDSFSKKITITKSKNTFNKDAVTLGYYVSNSNGTLLENASYSVSEYIPVYANTPYVRKFSVQYAIFDIAKVFISGGIGTSFFTPSNAFYVRISIQNPNLGIEQLEVGTISTSYQSYNAILGDFNNLSTAMASIINSSIHNRYKVYIYEGIYDIFSMLSIAEKNAIGIVVPDYVDLIGIGDRNKIILKVELPNNTTLDESTRISTLNIQKNNKLKNLWVTAKNCRYAVHADNTNTFKNCIQNIENCVFEHYGNAVGLWGVPTSWGEGTASGAEIHAKNSKFISHSTAPAFSTHNNVSFEEGDYHEFDNCDFINKDGNVLVFASLNCGKRCKVVLKGCRLTGAILQNQSNTSITTLDYDISGYGNEHVAHEVVLGSGQTLQTYIAFSEEITTRKNYSMAAITKGNPIKHQFYNQAVVMTSTDDKSMFLGLCAKDCLTTDENIIVKTSGYFKITDTTLTGVAVGNKIGVVNGALAIIADISQAIGVVVSGAWMKFL